MTRPLCVNCNFMTYVEEGPAYNYERKCCHPSVAKESPVTGESMLVYAIDAREDEGGACGPEGKLFAPLPARNRRGIMERWFGGRG